MLRHVPLKSGTAAGVLRTYSSASHFSLCGRWLISGVISIADPLAIDDDCNRLSPHATSKRKTKKRHWTPAYAAETSCLGLRALDSLPGFSDAKSHGEPQCAIPAAAIPRAGLLHDDNQDASDGFDGFD